MSRRLRVSNELQQSNFLIRHASLRQIQVFESVARNLSFTRAAEELHLTQPTVSSQVKSLVETIDLSLYEQIGRNIFLTEVGTQVAAACRDIINQLSNLEMLLDDYRGMKRGRLRIALVSTAKYFVPIALGRFSKRYPEIELGLKISNREEIFRRIDQNLDDLYILGQIQASNMDLKVVPFAPNPLVIIANKQHPLVGKSVSLQRLAEEPFIMREEGSGIRSTVEELFASHGLNVNERLSIDTNESVRLCVAGDLGIACVSGHGLDLSSDHSRIAKLNVEGFPIQKQWNIVYPSGKELSILAKEFLQLLQDEDVEQLDF